MAPGSTIWRKMWRRKTYTDDELKQTELKRCLSIWELTLYGVGQTIGSGIYVLSGTVVRHHAGPAAPISYLIGGLISIMSALCYAEFSTIVPRAGSSYSYTYYTIGEWVAFVIGWDLMLEHSMVAASTSRALISSLDLLLDNEIKNWTMSHIGRIDADGFSDYPEFLAGVIVLLVAVIVMFGAKQSVVTTALLAAVNLGVSVVIIVAGLGHASLDNWINPDHGGYFPHGIGGVLSASAIVFAAFSGYDAICTATEEAKDPLKALPIAIIGTMNITIIIYMCLTMTLTLAVPYYLVDPNAAFTKLFQDVDEPWAADLVTAVIMVAAFTVSLCNMFAVSRIAFAMARDGVLFRCFGFVSKRTGTPILAVLAFAVCTAVLAVVFDVEHLAEVVSVGTLMAATIVPLCVIILRYRCDPIACTSGDKTESTGKLKIAFRNMPLISKLPTQSAIALIVSVMTVTSIVTSLSIRCLTKYDVTGAGNVVCIACTALGTVLVFLSVLTLCMYEQNDIDCSFRIPMVPLFPVLAVFLNIICLGQISDLGWLRYASWMLVGTLIYFGYGMWNASGSSNDETIPLTKGHDESATRASHKSSTYQS